MFEDEIATVVAEHTAGDHEGDWNLDGLRAQLIGMIPTLTDADLAFLDDAREPATITDHLGELVAEHYERKRATVGPEGMQVLERLVMLRVIDSLWVEHLTAVDDMRRGIGLRAYSQREPLNEFKIEAYKMFDELKSTIRHDVTHTVFRVTLQQQSSQPRPVARNVTEGRAPVDGAPSAPCRLRWQRPGRGVRPRGAGRRSAATIHAGAARARSTRSATGRDRVGTDAGAWARRLPASASGTGCTTWVLGLPFLVGSVGWTEQRSRALRGPGSSRVEVRW